MIKYYERTVKELLHYGTDRRRLYDLGLKGRILVNYVRKTLWFNFNEYRSSRKTAYENQAYQVEIDSQTTSPLESLNLIEKTVSIIIPTKNAGMEFDITLEKIRNQKGIKEIELIIVDSGSTDRTIKLAEKYESNVYNIRPEEFNHGGTRNYGAEHAIGDYLLFMVQDAIPIGDHWLYDIITALESDENISAVTCRQVPRSDADLIAAYAMWNHYATMEFNKDKIVQLFGENLTNIPFIEKRRISGIEDVCTCFRRDIFNKFRFIKTDFGEDIELGMRLIENGYKICFLFSTGVIHSHTRDSAYIMKRYYIDTKYLNKIFNITPIIKESNIEQVLASILYLYNCLEDYISVINLQYSGEIDIDIFFSKLKDVMTKGTKNYSMREKRKDGLEKLLLCFENICEGKCTEDSFLLDNYLTLSENFRSYLKSFYLSCELNELVESSYKLFSICVGSYLGNLYYHRSGDKKFQQIDALLAEGV